MNNNFQYRINPETYRWARARRDYYNAQDYALRMIAALLMTACVLLWIATRKPW